MTLSVEGQAKVAADLPLVAFNGTGRIGNVGNVTLPPGGLANFTFVWTVPPGSQYDDQSASVEMVAWPGPPPPSPPPAPPGTVCPCPPTPDAASGACPEGTAPASVTLTNPPASEPSPAYVECLPLPQYDVFSSVFAFSTCFRWACLPPAFQVGADPKPIP